MAMAEVSDMVRLLNKAFNASVFIIWTSEIRTIRFQSFVSLEDILALEGALEKSPSSESASLESESVVK